MSQLLQWVISNLDTLSFVISLIALIVSIYSIWYTRHFNKYNIMITETEHIDDDKLPSMIRFKILNDSQKAITITDIELFHTNDDPVKILYSFDPYDFFNRGKTNAISLRMISPNEYQSPFTAPVAIPANEGIEFSYYIENFEPELKVIVRTDQRIKLCSKKKSFITRFVNAI